MKTPSLRVAPSTGTGVVKKKTPRLTPAEGDRQGAAEGAETPQPQASSPPSGQAPLVQGCRARPRGSEAKEPPPSPAGPRSRAQLQALPLPLEPPLWPPGTGQDAPP